MFSLRLQNYKSFLDAEVQLSKINILIGPNNSGKSAFLKFLLMLQQSGENEKYSKSDYELNGNSVDLGRFEDIIYYGQKERTINFTFKWDNCKFISANFFVLKHITNNLLFNESGSITCDIMPDSKSSSYTIENSLGEIHKFLIDNERKTINRGKKNISLDKSNVSFFRVFSSDDVKDEGFEEFVELEQKQLVLYFFLHSLKYINPLHSSPERTYNKRDDKGIQDIRDLNDVIYFLADSSIEKEKKDALVSKLNEMVRFLGIAKELKLMQAENIPAMQLWVKISEDEFWNNIKDVGYGLSMQLPMLLQSLISEVEGGAWLLFEQPEIHIYPRLQAKFIEAITTLGPNNNYIIETHSDIMVKKLQAMVKNGKLKAEDVAIHYFDRKTAETTVTRHSVLADGTLDIPLPEEFYDNSTDFILELLK